MAACGNRQLGLVVSSCPDAPGAVEEHLLVPLCGLLCDMAESIDETCFSSHLMTKLWDIIVQASQQFVTCPSTMPSLV